MSNKYGKGREGHLKNVKPKIQGRKYSQSSTIKKAKEYNKGMNVKLSKGQKIYARRIKGISNLSKAEEKIAFYVPKGKLLKGRTASKKLRMKRIKSYEKKTGKKASVFEKQALKYMSANELIKAKGITGISNPKIKSESKSKVETSEQAGGTITIQYAKLGSISWYDIPEDIRQGSREKDSFFYRNRETIWDNENDIIDLDKLLAEGEDGNDLTLKGFMEQSYSESSQLNTIFAYDDNDKLTAIKFDVQGDFENGYNVISSEGISKRIIDLVVSLYTKL